MGTIDFSKPIISTLNINMKLFIIGAAHLIGKRSADADAEAKPWLAYANYGYAGYPSAYAEAKPEAWYGAYGYGYSGYPYSYGYSGYPYGYAGYPYAYGYGKLDWSN